MRRCGSCGTRDRRRPTCNITFRESHAHPTTTSRRSANRRARACKHGRWHEPRMMNWHVAIAMNKIILYPSCITSLNSLPFGLINRRAFAARHALLQAPKPNRRRFRRPRRSLHPALVRDDLQLTAKHKETKSLKKALGRAQEAQNFKPNPPSALSV